MGGLVIKSAFIRAKQMEEFFSIAQRIRAIFFFATPHQSIDIAQPLINIAQLSSGNRPFMTNLHHCSTVAQFINEEFGHCCQDLDLYSFYETLPTRFGLTKKFVVEKHLAMLSFANEVSYPLNADHRGVCKYDSTWDQNYRIVRNALALYFERFRYKVVLSRRGPDHGQCKALSTFLGRSDTHEDDFVFINGLRLTGSCEWLMNKKSFQMWQDSPQTQIYWISAKPGTGKTVLSGKMIAHLRSLDHDCAFFSFKLHDRSKSTITSFLLSMAWQMSSQNSEALRVVLDTCEKDNQLSKADYRTIWRKLFLEGILRLQHLRPQYWVIDALDECESDHELVPMLLKALGTGQVRIFLTSRNLFESYRQMAHSDARVISEEILADDTKSDIALYLKANMHELPCVDENARQEVVRTILDKSAGCFLWVTLVMHELREAHTHGEIRLALESVPSDMNKLFSNGSIADDRASSVGSTWVNKSTMSGFSRPGNEVPSVDSGYISWTYQPSTGSQKDNKNDHNQPTAREEHFPAEVKEVEEEDVLSQKSVESFGEGISSMGESLIGNDIQGIAQTLILEVLENDEVLNPLLRESLEKFDRYRVIKNFAGFIDGYCE
jgi:hypothetical protein